MTDPVYYFIATKDIAPVNVPANSLNQLDFNRRIRNSVQGLAGGALQAGTVKMMATSSAIANHVICDGTVYSYETFPDLFRYLGNTYGGDGVTTFAVPDYRGTVAPIMPLATPSQTVEGGTVVTDGTVVTTPTQPGQTGGSTGGNTVSGGRAPIRNLD